MTQKFIDRDGLKVLWKQASLQDYPNNETLMAVIDAIDETKANKDEIVQSDWNQNDETQIDYVKNRPFYTGDPIETFIVEETTFELVDGIGQLTAIQPLEVGQEYAINLDGTTYNCVAQFHEGMGSVYIGNFALVDPDVESTGEPFFIAPMNSDTELGIMVNSDVAEHTVSIVGMIPEIHQIDPKYISYIAGRNVKGKTFIIHDEEIIAQEGAEIFNDYKLNKAIGSYSHAEGNETTAIGDAAHAEGQKSFASGNYSHAEGYRTVASGDYSHAEGNATEASGNYSHAEGTWSEVSGLAAHAEGNATEASGFAAHSEGWATIASGQYQHVQGKWNINDVDADGNALNTYAHIVGNGSSHSNCSNAHTLDWSGNAWFAGDVYTGSISGTNRDEGSKKLATEEYVDSQIPTDDDAFALSIEMGLIEPIENNGYVLTDVNGVIYTI